MPDKVIVRPAVPSNLSKICLLSADSFKTHHNVSKLHPYISKYPKDFLRGETYGCKAYFYSRGVHSFVLEVEDSGDRVGGGDVVEKVTGNRKKMIGYSMWGRIGRSEVGKRWRKQSILRG